MVILRQFLRLEAAGGIILLFTALLAVILDNSPLAWLYDGLLATPVEVRVGALELAKPLLLWINDGLMAVFFFLVGLEIKREVLRGHLSSWEQASLPAFGAFGGMAVPALIYVAINWGNPATLNGWAIPAATDIAFALGILSLLGNRVPIALKVFLLALAIIDDLGAIIIIALFYTADLSLSALAIAAVCLAALLTLNLCNVTRVAAYVIVGVILWVGVLKSGVHATLAGVVLALAIPLEVKRGGRSPLEELEHKLHPWVAFGIMPLFAFANAGVSFSGMSFGSLLDPLPLGILAGLFIGKQLGVFAFTYGATRLGWCQLPAEVNWLQFYGVALLTGVGFTMSLFIGTLAFADPAQSTGVRLGVLVGSGLSAVCGYLLLFWASPRRTEATQEAPSSA